MPGQKPLLTGTAQILGTAPTAILLAVFGVGEAISCECLPVFLWHFAFGASLIGHGKPSYLSLPF
jgi:hypothetical protein